MYIQQSTEKLISDREGKTMKEKVTCSNIFLQNSGSQELKPWQGPAVEELDVNQTGQDFIELTDSTEFFS
jgi:hypothetical protein